MFKNRIIIERARVWGSDKDEEMCLVVSWRWLRTRLLGLSRAGHSWMNSYFLGNNLCLIPQDIQNCEGFLQWYNQIDQVVLTLVFVELEVEIG